jgi:hypothetical protein
LLAIWIPIGAWITAAIVLLTIIAMFASARQERVPTGLVFSVFVAASVELISVGAVWLIATSTDDRLDGSPWLLVFASGAAAIMSMWLWQIGRRDERCAKDELADVEREATRDTHSSASDNDI